MTDDYNIDYGDVIDWACDHETPDRVLPFLDAVRLHPVRDIREAWPAFTKWSHYQNRARGLLEELTKDAQARGEYDHD